jgi:hypothetical protein
MAASEIITFFVKISVFGIFSEKSGAFLHPLYDVIDLL